ncbi:MAG: FAD-dependent oxidoreductase, partial [Firmicutes bacterium]|nr:FAD-dependent oxidoreductase [Bacillota bacterium]
MKPAVVVGGGVIGGAVALALLERGIGVTLIERGEFGQEASRAAAGMVCPTAEMFDGEDGIELFRESLVLYEPWVRRLEALSDIDVQYRPLGMVRLIFSQDEAKQMEQRVQARSSSEYEWWDPRHLRAKVPAVGDSACGAVFFPRDAQLHPIFLLKALKRAILRLGGHLLEHVAADALILKNHDVVGVRTAMGPLYADLTVLAAGAWSQGLAEGVGLHLPVFPVKGEMMAVAKADVSLQHILQGPGGMILPRRDGSLHVGVTMELRGFDQRRTVSALANI